MQALASIPANAYITNFPLQEQDVPPGGPSTPPPPPPRPDVSLFQTHTFPPYQPSSLPVAQAQAPPPATLYSPALAVPTPPSAPVPSPTAFFPEPATDMASAGQGSPVDLAPVLRSPAAGGTSGPDTSVIIGAAVAVLLAILACNAVGFIALNRRKQMAHEKNLQTFQGKAVIRGAKDTQARFALVMFKLSVRFHLYYWQCLIFSGDMHICTAYVAVPATISCHCVHRKQTRQCIDWQLECMIWQGERCRLPCNIHNRCNYRCRMKRQARLF